MAFNALHPGHPGVYVQEVPSAHTIQGAPTSVPAFVGLTESGPFNTATLITSWASYQRIFGGFAWRAFTPLAVFQFFAEGGGQAYVVRIQPSKAGARGTATVPSSSDIQVQAASNGAWSGNLYLATTCAKGSAFFDISVLVSKSVFDFTQNSNNQNNLDVQLLNAYVQQNSLALLPINGGMYVLESFTGFTAASLKLPLGSTDPASSPLAQQINKKSMFIRVVSGTTAPTTKSPTPQTTSVAFKGGTDDAFEPTSALNYLTKVQGISLLAIPDTVKYVLQSGASDLPTQAHQINLALNYCEKYGNLFLVADPPYLIDIGATTATQTILNFKSGNGGTSDALSSSYGAIYHPWLLTSNPITGVNMPVPPSGTMLGRYAYTDNNVGVFKSPAGIREGALRTAFACAVPISDEDQDVLNPAGVNALRNLINYGNVIWGARTLSLDGDWTYLAIRRFFIFVEQSLLNSLQWVVFEPNDQRLWAAINRDVGAFLTTLWHQGALFGESPTEAFFVVCDESNNPPETRTEGILYIDIGLAPVYPAEFVVIRISQKTAGPDSGS
jgi:uncharacterized protein